MRPDYISAVGRDDGRVGHSIVPTRANCRSAFDRLQPVGQTCLRRRPQELVPCVCRNLRRNDRTGKFSTLLWATFISKYDTIIAFLGFSIVNVFAYTFIKKINSVQSSIANGCTTIIC